MKWIIIFFTLFFISNHIVINNRYHLLLLHKTSVKTKKHIIILIIEKWGVILNLKKLIIKVERVIILMIESIVMILISIMVFNVILIMILNEKSQGNFFLIYGVAYKPQCGAKPLRIIFDKVDEYVKKYNSTKYLTLFHSGEKYERVFGRIRYLIMLKSNISEVYSHKYTKIKTNSDDTFRKIIKYACNNTYLICF